MDPKCRICGLAVPADRQGRCRLCREVKAAYDAGLSYGIYKSILYDLYGDQPELPPDFYRECPVCHRVFLPRRKNQIYDVPACGQIMAARKYRRKQRAGLGAPAIITEGVNGANAADQNGWRAHEDEPFAQS